MNKKMKILREYEKVLGQMINLDKSLFYLRKKTPVEICNKSKELLALHEGLFLLHIWDVVIF